MTDMVRVFVGDTDRLGNKAPVFTRAGVQKDDNGYSEVTVSNNGKKGKFECNKWHVMDRGLALNLQASGWIKAGELEPYVEQPKNSEPIADPEPETEVQPVPEVAPEPTPQAQEVVDQEPKANIRDDERLAEFKREDLDKMSDKDVEDMLKE